MGREVGPLFTNKKTPEAQRLGSLARTMLGELKARMKALGLLMGVQKKVLPDGSSIKVFSNRGIDKAVLEAPPEKVGSRCKAYMESGRQRWLSGTLEISGDLSGCNGRCPGTPLANGDPSAALAKDGRALCCQMAPPSSFTGSMPLFIQAVYGSKRDDVAYVGDGRISIAGVTFGHDYTYSSILYRDVDNVYWVLTLDRIQSATIQKWIPCDSSFGFEDENDIAYRLSWLKPRGDAVSLNCVGVLNAAGSTVHYGWHAKKNGTEGHIVLLGGLRGDDYDYTGPKLCKYELLDSGAAPNQNESWEAYVQRRFSVAFIIVEQHDEAYPYIVCVVPGYSEESFANGKMAQNTSISGYIGFNIKYANEAPLYCRYTVDDELDVVRFSNGYEPKRGPWIENQYDPPPVEYVCDTTGSISRTIRGGYSCLIFGSVESFNSVEDLGTEWYYAGMNYIGSDIDLQSLSEHDAQLAWVTTNPNPEDIEYITDFCGHTGHLNTVILVHTTLATEQFWRKHIFILPEGNHESFLIYELDARNTSASTLTGPHTNDHEVGWTRYNHVFRRLYYYPDDGDEQILDEIEYETGTDYGTIEPIRGVQGTPDDPIPLEESLLYTDKDIGQYLMLSPHWDQSYTIDLLSDRRSFNHNHRNSWVLPDKSIERHEGYDDLVADACFVGKS